MISDWKESLIELGETKVGKQHNIHFEYEGYQQIEGANSSCGCSTPEIDGRVIRVTFKAPDIPKHLQAAGKKSYTTTKSILVSLAGQEKPDHLKFKATIHKS